jgi:hypothetical protein
MNYIIIKGTKIGSKYLTFDLHINGKRIPAIKCDVCGKSGEIGYCQIDNYNAIRKDLSKIFDNKIRHYVDHAIGYNLLNQFRLISKSNIVPMNYYGELEVYDEGRSKIGSIIEANFIKFFSPKIINDLFYNPVTYPVKVRGITNNYYGIIDEVDIIIPCEEYCNNCKLYHLIINDSIIHDYKEKIIQQLSQNNNSCCFRIRGTNYRILKINYEYNLNILMNDYEILDL